MLIFTLTVATAGCGDDTVTEPIARTPFAVTCADPAPLGATDIGLVDEIDDSCLEAGDPAFEWRGFPHTPSPGRCYTAPERVELSTDKALVLVTHLTTEFDQNALLEPLAEQYLACQIADPAVQVVYLENTSDQQHRYYVRDLRPDYTVFSHAGEVPFDVPTNEVRIIGGYWSQCLTNTGPDALIRINGRDTDLTVKIVAPLIYTAGESGLADVANGPELTNLYLSQRVVSLAEGLDYLTPDAQRSFLLRDIDLALRLARSRGQATFPNHRIELRFRGQSAVIQPQADPEAPLLLFEIEG